MTGAHEPLTDDCTHEHCRTYVFHCDGWTYRAFECLNCPASTSLPITAAALVALNTRPVWLRDEQLQPRP